MTMKMTDLTPDEVELIRQRRNEQTARHDALHFQRHAISTAHRFSKWSAQSGYGLTFSTFVNQFEYQHVDAKDVFNAVERILNAALPQ